jgi:serine/threonine protein kinase
MDPQWPNVRAIFERALELPPGDERENYLNEACAGHTELRDRVVSLIKADAEAGSFLAKPALDEDRTHPFVPLGERPGSIIGPYKLLEQIGEGGFGAVFMAEQERPVRRRVAVKVIKPGMDTRQVIARFEAERQAIALMEHPNIARVLDAGATDSGRPYFVMELVRGIPLTEFCDQNRLTVEERLKLFVSVCSAVQHAHQKGIIHRDIKPSNVMVTLHDGLPVIKVIDFGVAKATGQRLTDKTLFTAFAQMVGTPLYMSPEQAEMSGLDVDTRSDIYSLGVLLYELLTGTTPFDKVRMQHAGYDEFRRIIREEEPPRPSTRISTLGPAATLVSLQRKSDTRKLGQSIRGELDWIVMKCLDKDRNRRYDSAGSLARDVERYLHNEPVQACPPSALYRFRKLIRRNKTTLLILAVVAVAIGLALILVQAGISIASLKQKNFELQGYRPVRLVTQPPGARLAIVPIHEHTGELNSDPTTIVRPSGVTPLTVDLKPGRYFVEAVLPGNYVVPDFAEGYLAIPASETAPNRMIKENRRAGLPDNLHPTRLIQIPQTSKVIEGMVVVPIDEELRRKNPMLPRWLYVDAKETKPDDLKLSRFRSRNQTGEPVVSFDGATEWAWSRGVRLPSASEFDAIMKAARDGDLRSADSDRPATMDDLFGGLAEWSTTKYANSTEGDPYIAKSLRRMHVLKGYGDPSKLPGLERTPDGYLIASPDTGFRLIGCRGIRSGAPRFVTQ